MNAAAMTSYALQNGCATSVLTEYATHAPVLARLYVKGKEEQWNAASLPWHLDHDPEDENFPDQQIPIFGTAFWRRLTPPERRRLRHELSAWTLSNFLHGEQGALLVASQLVDALPTLDGKLFAASQVMDEARHVEVYQRYLREKIEKDYPATGPLKLLLDTVLADGRWDMKLLGMQIIVEGLALGAFGLIRSYARDRLMRHITTRVMQDEARHVAFGVVALREFYAEASPAEIAVRQDFVHEACALMRDRFLQEEVWERMGLPVRECCDVARESRAAREFRVLLFCRLVPALRKTGLLTGTLPARLDALGILKYQSPIRSYTAALGLPLVWGHIRDSLTRGGRA